MRWCFSFRGKSELLKEWVEGSEFYFVLFFVFLSEQRGIMKPNETK